MDVTECATNGTTEQKRSNLVKMILRAGSTIIKKHRIPLLVEGYETKKRFITTKVWIDFEELIRTGILRMGVKK